MVSSSVVFLSQITMSCKPSFREAGPRSYREVWFFKCWFYSLLSACW